MTSVILPVHAEFEDGQANMVRHVARKLFEMNAAKELIDSIGIPLPADLESIDGLRRCLATIGLLVVNQLHQNEGGTSTRSVA